MTLTDAYVPAEFVEFVRDELARRRADPPPVVFVSPPSDWAICLWLWYGEWDGPSVDLADDEAARLVDGVLYVRRSDPRSTFAAAIATGAP